MSLTKIVNGAKGKIFYGMHFYPGVAQYDDAEGKGSYRVFLNESTLRKMDPTFAGCPIFVEHVSEVDPNIKELRAVAEGWVVESFFNEADGKHWAKFVVTSDEAEAAIKRGYKLSNCYFPTDFAQGGAWNNVDYQKEVTNGNFEHLAIVSNPRYEESVIMTPEQFKAYNDKLKAELLKIANSKPKENEAMKLDLWKRTKVDNSADLEGVSLMLPKSKREMTITQLVNEMDEHEEKKKANVADMGGMVKLHDSSECSVADLVAKHKNMSEEHGKMKKMYDAMVEQHGLPQEGLEVDAVDHPTDDVQLNADDEEAAAEKKKKEDEEKKANDKKHFDALKNARPKNEPQLQTAVVELTSDMVQRGKQRYGSKK